jgi:hypothetical protein
VPALPKGASGTLPDALVSGIGCAASTSPSACAVVGSFADSKGNAQGLLIAGSAGGTWSASAAPLPGGASPDPDVSVSGVSCPAAGSCTASGVYHAGSAQASGGLLLTLSKGAWTAAAAPLPAGGSSADPLSVSCATAGKCVSVGTFVRGARGMPGSAGPAGGVSGLIESLAA